MTSVASFLSLLPGRCFILRTLDRPLQGPATMQATDEGGSKDRQEAGAGGGNRGQREVVYADVMPSGIGEIQAVRRLRERAGGEKEAGAAAGIPALLIDDLPYPVVGGEGEIGAAGSIEDVSIKRDGYGRDIQENPDIARIDQLEPGPQVQIRAESSAGAHLGAVDEHPGGIQAAHILADLDIPVPARQPAAIESEMDRPTLDNTGRAGNGQRREYALAHQILLPYLPEITNRLVIDPAIAPPLRADNMGSMANVGRVCQGIENGLWCLGADSASDDRPDS